MSGGTWAADPVSPAAVLAQFLAQATVNTWKSTDKTGPVGPSAQKVFFLQIPSGGALGAGSRGGTRVNIDLGDLRPIVDQTYPFHEAPQALAHVERGRTKGKVAITMVPG